jgi:hypothetical protein
MLYLTAVGTVHLLSMYYRLLVLTHRRFYELVCTNILKQLNDTLGQTRKGFGGEGTVNYGVFVCFDFQTILRESCVFLMHPVALTYGFLLISIYHAFISDID